MLSLALFAIPDSEVCTVVQSIISGLSFLYQLHANASPFPKGRLNPLGYVLHRFLGALLTMSIVCCSRKKSPNWPWPGTTVRICGYRFCNILIECGHWSGSASEVFPIEWLSFPFTKHPPKRTASPSLQRSDKLTRLCSDRLGRRLTAQSALRIDFLFQVVAVFGFY